MNAVHSRAAADRGPGSGQSGRAPLFARMAAALVLVVYVGGLCVSAWLERHLGPQGEDPIEEVALFAGLGMFALVGALLVARRPENLVGWIMGAVALIGGIFPTSESYAAYVMTTRGRPDALAVFGAWANGWYWFALLALVFIYLPLLFPDGKLPSRRWLPVAVLPGIGLVGMIVLGSFVESFEGQNVDYRIDNPVGIAGLAYVEDLPGFDVWGGGVLLVGTVGAVASVAVRFRRSRGIERQQLKWFLYAAAPIPLLPVSNLLPLVVDAVAFAWVLFGLPAAVGISVLRYRLYDIDVLINRTLVYGSLTATLVLVYLGGVVALQRLLSPVVGEGNHLAVVASTLAIAALFSPLRRRLQGFIDRGFYRRRYDAAKTLEAFSAKLRDETDLDRLGDDLVSVARETVQPEHAWLWLRAPEERG